MTTGKTGSHITSNKEALKLPEGELTLDSHYAWVDVWVMEQVSNQADPKQLQQEFDGKQSRSSWRHKPLNLQTPHYQQARNNIEY